MKQYEKPADVDNQELYNSKFEENIESMRYFPPKYITKAMILKAASKEISLLNYVPAKFRNQELYNEIFSINYMTILYIPSVFVTDEMILTIAKKDISMMKRIPQYINKLPDEYKTPDFYISLYEYDQGLMRYFPEDYMSLELCLEMVYRDISLARFLPSRFQTQENYDKIFDNNIESFQYIPAKFITQDMCIRAVEYDASLFAFVPKKFKTEKYWISVYSSGKVLASEVPFQFRTKEMWEELVKTGKISLEQIPNDMITSDMILSALNNNNIPFNYFRSRKGKRCIEKLNFSQDIWNMAYDKGYIYINDIPLENRTLHMYEKSFEKGEIAFNEIPRKFYSKKILEILYNRDIEAFFAITTSTTWSREVYENLLHINFDRYSQYVPVQFCDDEMIELSAYYLNKFISSKKRVTNFSLLVQMTIKKYPKLLGAANDELFDSVITSELRMLLSFGGTKESIALKYGVTLSRIDSVIESLKISDAELYNDIKSKMVANHDIWYQNMLSDCNNLNNIILSLGNINHTLNIDQKAKFAYLCFKYIHNSLEEIYAFINRNSININIDLIKMFFKKVLKYNYLKDENTLVPERKTISFNNQWINKYNRDRFFKVKDGVAQMSLKYDKVEITLAVADKIVDILTSENIPLNTTIVQLAFREYNNDKLLEYIERLHSYDSEFANAKEKKLG